MKNPYAELAIFYDSLFLALGKDYQLESRKINMLIEQNKKSDGNKLLDLGCGTGEHIKHLKNEYQITGIDVSDEMLALAKQKNPEASFVRMDMTDFQLNQKFDVIICLFSAIGYITSKRRLNTAIRNVSNHLKNGGVFIVEPWFSRLEIERNLDLVEFGDNNGLKACRMRETKIVGNVAKLKSYVMISKNSNVTRHVSNHKFGLFTKEDFIESFQKNKLQMCTTDLDLTGRGLFLGTKIT